MPQVSPQEFRELVRSHTDIVGLIGESIGLEPRSGGREHVGLCPFHSDNNPSLRVYPERGTFRCWSCNTGGDCFTFVMEREKVSFPEALQILARRANLEIPKYVSGRSQDAESSRAKLFEVLAWAEQLFHKILMESPEGERARAYLRDRGFSKETVKTFRLGFHPDSWQWIIDRARGKFSTKLLLEARLVGEKNGNYYDNFKNRVLFPIHNERGQAVSFGGRILPGDESDAKYWNGPESVVFHKSRLLYAIHQARDAIQDQKQVLITEGYTDCIACHQFGVKNVVATLGTALTDSHVTAIKRFSRQVILVFDGDGPGQDAAAKAVERFLAQDVDLRILTLPTQMDPADFLEHEGAEAFKTLASKAPEAWEFRFRKARNKFGTDSIDGRQQILEEMLDVLACVPQMASSVREPMLIANLAQRLSIPESTVRDRLKEVRSRQKKTDRVEINESPRDSRHEDIQRILTGKLSAGERLECDLLEMMLAAPEFARFVAAALNQTQLRNPISTELLQSCLAESDAAGELTLTGLIDRMPNQELKSLVVYFDEQADAKDLAKRLRADELTSEGCPVLLQQTLDAIRDRDAATSHQNVAIKISESTDGRNGLDESTEALLRQAAEFHQKRATRRAGA